MSAALEPRMLQRALRERILADLQAKVREDDTYAVTDVRAAARRAGVSERTVYAWLAEGLPQADRPRTFIWDPAYDAVLAECRGNVSELHRRLAQAGVESLPSEQWLRKLARARFGKRGLLHMHSGEAASRVHKLRRIIEVPEVTSSGRRASSTSPCPSSMRTSPASGWTSGAAPSRMPAADLSSALLPVSTAMRA